MVAISSSPMALLFLIFVSVFSVDAASNSSLFTPAAMLSAPRRGTALPNAAGTLALYTTTTWNFTTHSRKYGLWVLDLETGTSTLFSNSSAIGEAQWLGEGNGIVWLNYENDGSSTFLVGDATTPNAE